MARTPASVCCCIKADEPVCPKTLTYKVSLGLSTGGRKLGVAVVKGQGGWLVTGVNQGSILHWNSQPAQKGDVVVPGDKIVSGNGTPLLPGMEVVPCDYDGTFGKMQDAEREMALDKGVPVVIINVTMVAWVADCARDGQLTLLIARAETVVVDGRPGSVVWDGRPAQQMVSVLWRDGTEGALVQQGGQWCAVRLDVAVKFVEDTPVVDCNGMRLGDDGARDVALILEAYSGGSPKHVCLNNTGIRDAGASALADAIERCGAHQVDLFGNFFNAELRERIESTIWQLRQRKLVLTAHAEKDGEEVRVSFRSLSGEEPLPPSVVGPDKTVKELRGTLEAALGRTIVLVCAGPSGQCVQDSLAVGELPRLSVVPA